MAQRTTSQQLAELGSLIADSTRAEVLCALMDGRAHTGAELARHAGVAPSTMSEHLSRLLDGGIVAVEAQGRHRYWRLASDDLALLLETLGATSISLDAPTAPAALRYARTCYDHLAGELAVELHDALLAQGHLVADDRGLDLTTSGYELLERLGADVATIRESRRLRARPCLDWTQRRHHLAGTAGAALLTAFLDQGWIRRGSQPRSIEVSRSGAKAFATLFDIGTVG
ncbi:MAG: winged helix-turn-helix domain-containing protein [Actinomycetota bacterium]